MITVHDVAAAITAHDDARPRSQQTSIGPSGLGHPCDRNLTYHALQVPHLPVRRDRLAAWIGTAVHAQLEDVIGAGHLPGWVAEVEAPIPGWGITAHVDAYHQASGTVLDWKVVGPSSLAKLRSAMSAQYRTQVHLYGLALHLAGLPVATVAVCLLPRSGVAADLHLWSEPWDEDYAGAALDRWHTILTSAARHGTAALPAAATSGASPCVWCPWHAPAAGDTTDLARLGCPGHGQEHGSSPRPWQPQQQGAA